MKLILIVVATFSALLATVTPSEAEKPRARDLDIPFDGTPGKHNAITDVPGVLVGHETVIEGKGRHAARTGVTAILARPLKNKSLEPVFAATFTHNGDGEMTGARFIDETGYLISPILLTNTISVGTVHSAVVRWSLKTLHEPVNLPVVAETWDGRLNDIYGFHVKQCHVLRALKNVKNGPVGEGNVGGGTGMICHGFKGGIGTASRVITQENECFTVGVLVQANHGKREDLRVAGIPVGAEICGYRVQIKRPSGRRGSIIVVVATDAPLLPHQLKRVTKRVSMGLARNGSYTATDSGDVFLAFSTKPRLKTRGVYVATQYLEDDEQLNGIFRATVQATEEAIINAMVAAEKMCGVHGNRVYALPHKPLRDILRRHRRLEEKASQRAVPHHTTPSVLSS